RDEVVASVQATFPKSSWARVLELLDSYDVEPCERERERVQGAILKLSAASEGARVRGCGKARLSRRAVLGGISERIEIGHAGKETTGKQSVREIRDRAAERYLIYRLREIKTPPPRAPAHSQSSHSRVE